MECRNLDDLARLISKRDNISLNEAHNLIDACANELEEARSYDEVEDILLYDLGLEMDYFDLFIGGML